MQLAYSKRLFSQTTKVRCYRNQNVENSRHFSPQLINVRSSCRDCEAHFTNSHNALLRRESLFCQIVLGNRRSRQALETSDVDTLRKTTGRVGHGVDVITVTHEAHTKRLAG